MDLWEEVKTSTVEWSTHESRIRSLCWRKVVLVAEHKEHFLPWLVPRSHAPCRYYRISGLSHGSYLSFISFWHNIYERQDERNFWLQSAYKGQDHGWMIDINCSIVFDTYYFELRHPHSRLQHCSMLVRLMLFLPEMYSQSHRLQSCTHPTVGDHIIMMQQTERLSGVTKIAKIVCKMKLRRISKRYCCTGPSCTINTLYFFPMAGIFNHFPFESSTITPKGEWDDIDTFDTV